MILIQYPQVQAFMSTSDELQARIVHLEMRNRCAETVIAISTAMARAKTPSDILGALIEPVPDSVKPADIAASLLYVESTNEAEAEWLQVHAVWPKEANHHGLLPGTRLPLSQFEEAQEWLVNPDAPRFIEDVSADSRLDPQSSAFFLAHNIHALVLMPLIRANEWIGLLTVSWNQPHLFSEEETIIYKALPPLLTPTLEVHQLIHELENKVAVRTTELMIFKTLADNSPVAIGMLGADTQFIYMNAAFNQMFGLDADSVDMSLTAILADEGDELSAQLTAMQTTDDFTRDVEYRRQDGPTFTGQTTGFVITDPIHDHPYQILLIEDITARLQAEAATNQTRWQLQSMFDHMPAFIYVKDMNGRFIMVNRQWSGRTNISLQDALGKTAQELFPHMQYETPWEPLEQQVLDTGEPMHVEEVGRTTGKTYFAAKFLLYDATGQPYAFCNTSIDITERIEAEKATQQTRQQLHDMFDHTPAIVFTKDLQGHHIMVNQEWRKYTGLYNDENVIGKTPYQIYPHVTDPDDRFSPNEQAVLDTGQAITFEEYSERTGYTVLSTKFLLRDADGEIYAICNSSVDITERKRIGEEVRQTRQQLQDMFDNTPAVVFAKDLDGRYLFVNQKWRDRAGMSAQEAIGKRESDLFPDSIYSDNKWLPHEIDILENQQAITYESTGFITGADYLVTKFPLHDGDGKLYALGAISIDITTQKRIEEEIKTARQQFQDMFDHTPAVVFAKDMEGRVLFANREWAERVGYDHRAVIGLREADLFPELNYIDGKWLPRELKVLESQQSITFEEIGPVTGYHYLNVLFPLFDAAGMVYGLCYSSTDIGVQKRIEEEVRIARQQLQDMFDNIPAVVFAKDLAGRIIFANSEWCKRAEVAHQNVIGRIESELFPDYDFIDGKWLPGEQAVLETLEPQVLEITGVVTGRAYLNTLFPLVDTSGAVYAVCSCAIDITDRKQIEAEREELTAHVWEQAERVAHIISTVPEGVVLLDPQRRIILANPLATEDLKQLEGVEVGDVLHTLGDHLLENLLTSPPAGLWHEVMVTVDEIPRYLEVIARPIETSPTNAGWVLVWRDVTREREIQQQVQQQERLAAVGQLAAGIAHDFNNIVAVIVLYAQIVRKTKADDRLQVIAEQAHRASNLIEQILDFSRRSVMERQPLDLTPFLKEQVKLLARIMPENIIINLTVIPNNHTLNADPTRIQQTIMNLAVNARDAMPEGGHLDITIDRSVVTESNQPLAEMALGQWVKLIIADTGAGVSSDALPHIFDPFFTTKEPGEGTGLGLAQVYGIVHQHDGHITVQTEVGVGTTFTIYLPSLVQQIVTPPLDGAPLIQGNGELILLVEDNSATREALVASLELLNYQVITAVDGVQALEVWQERRAQSGLRAQVDLVVSDVVMPNMGGVALFHALKAHNAAVRVILLTGHVMDQNLDERWDDLKAQGLQNWLQKPADLPVLARAIAQALR
ncbi:PAS domain-containing protein [Chloroflexota bacterium]